MRFAAIVALRMEARIAPEPPVFPDDPRKWDGWSNYQSANPYERLCLNPADNPDTEQIQQHCTALLQWWKKKLPLKNQPTNPLAQLLGRGLDDFSRYLLQAQMQLLDPEQRRKVDRALAEEAQQNAIEDFARYVAFCIKDGVLTGEAKANLAEYGQRNGLSDAEIARTIEEELRRNEARPAEAEEHAFASGDSEHELIRILRLSEVNFWSATDSVRQILITVGTNLGIERDRTE